MRFDPARLGGTCLGAVRLGNGTVLTGFGKAGTVVGQGQAGSDMLGCDPAW